MTKRDIFYALAVVTAVPAFILGPKTLSSRDDLTLFSVHEAAHAFTAHYYGLLESVSLQIHRSAVFHDWFIVGGGSVSSKIRSNTPFDIETTKNVLNIALSGIIGARVLGINEPERGGQSDLRKVERIANAIALNEMNVITESFSFEDILNNRFILNIPEEAKQNMESFAALAIENSRQITLRLMQSSQHVILEIATALRTHEELSEQQVAEIILAAQRVHNQIEHRPI